MTETWFDPDWDRVMGLPGQIQVSAASELLLRETHRLERRGAIDIKGKGLQETWFLRGRR